VSDVGHNSGDDRLRLLIERIERLEEEKKGIADDIRDVYTNPVAPSVLASRARVRVCSCVADTRSARLT